MGMYDEIVCELDFLPKPFPSFIKEGHQFQTKSLDCCLETFHINKQKRLTCNGKDLNYHGNLNFYTSNIRGCGHGFYFTSKGEPYEDVDYLAVFNQGELQEIKQIKYQTEKALPVKEQNFQYLNDYVAVEPPESFLNGTFYVQYGGLRVIEGHSGICVAESEKEIVLKVGDGRGQPKFETHRKNDFDRIVFYNKEHAMNNKEQKEKMHKKEEQRLKRLMEQNSVDGLNGPLPDKDFKIGSIKVEEKS